jgi:hypothetical protein
MNQQVREGLAHTDITTQNGVLFIQKRPPFQGESGTAGLPRAKAPGLFCGPPSASGGAKFRWRRYVDAYRRPPDRGSCLAGSAPVTKRSGKQRPSWHVHQRWACNKHLRHAVHLFSDRKSFGAAGDLVTNCKICDEVRLGSFHRIVYKHPAKRRPPPAPAQRSAMRKSSGLLYAGRRPILYGQALSLESTHSQ